MVESSHPRASGLSAWAESSAPEADCCAGVADLQAMRHNRAMPNSAANRRQPGYQVRESCMRSPPKQSSQIHERSCGKYTLKQVSMQAPCSVTIHLQHVLRQIMAPC